MRRQEQGLRLLLVTEQMSGAAQSDAQFVKGLGHSVVSFQWGCGIDVQAVAAGCGQEVAEIPGFGDGNYITYLTPAASRALIP